MSRNYVVAVPTYNREQVVQQKTLQTLKDGKVDKRRIYIFVANKEQYTKYKNALDPAYYHKIVVGHLGITNQRIFISKYFPEGQYIVSMDDDVEQLESKKGDSLVKIRDIHSFFMEAYDILKEEGLYLWGIYPVHNPFFMKKDYSIDLKFIIGVLHGYINRHNKKLYPSPKIGSKEDYEMSILFYKMDGGVLRFNDITPKTKFYSEGGLGKDRFEANKFAAEYLQHTYPDIVTIFHRKNGMTEIRLKKNP